MSVSSVSQRLERFQDTVARVQTARDTSAGSACLSRVGSAQASAGAPPLQQSGFLSSSLLLCWHQHFPVSLAQVRQDWGIKESVGPTGWQAVMRQYLRQDRQAAAVLTSQGDRSPPASPPRQAEPCPEGGLPRHSCEAACIDAMLRSVTTLVASRFPTAARTSSEGCSSIGQLLWVMPSATGDEWHKMSVHQADAIVRCAVHPDTSAFMQAGQRQAQCCHRLLGQPSKGRAARRMT